MRETDEVLRLRRRVRLMYEAAARIGVDPDVRQTTRDIVDVVVPALGHVAIIDLNMAVPTGEDPEGLIPPPPGKVARLAACGDVSADMVKAGEVVPSLSLGPYDASLAAGEVVVVEDAWGFMESRYGTDLTRQVVPDRTSRGLIAPLQVRGRLLGALCVWQDNSRALRPEDVETLDEIASRGGLAIDNARRYTREHVRAVALQRLLLPRLTSDTQAAQTAAVYRPAGLAEGVGGGWFDVIPLSSTRIGLVMGEASGPGLAATATMGRVRAAMLTLADLDLDPDELLTHVDDLVRRLAEEASADGNAVGARCVYAVYDPVTCRCAIAGAGHPAPLLVAPGRDPVPVDLAPGPALGAGGTPFETVELTLEPTSVLVFYGDALLDGNPQGAGATMDRLRESVARHCRSDLPLADACRRVVQDMVPDRDADDVILLLARTRSVPASDTAEWTFPADASSVPEIRKAVTDRLAAWSLDEQAFATELVVSELAGNAVRHAGGSMTVRLIRGRDRLVCEVGDDSSTQPRIRRAHSTDEGGRGLFLVAEVSDRWGCRFGPRGKTIWAEQRLEHAF